MNVVVYQKHRANKRNRSLRCCVVPDGFAAASLTPEVTATFADGPDVVAFRRESALKKYPD